MKTTIYIGVITFIFSLLEVYAEEVRYLKPEEVATGDCDVWNAVFTTENQFVLTCGDSAEVWQTGGFETERQNVIHDTGWTDLVKGPENSYFATISGGGFKIKIWKVTPDGNPVFVSVHDNYKGTETRFDKIHSVVFDKNALFMMGDTGFVYIVGLDKAMKLGQLFTIHTRNVTSVAIDTKVTKVADTNITKVADTNITLAIALDNSKHQVILANLMSNQESIGGGFKYTSLFYPSTVRKLLFVPDDRLLAAVTDSGFEFRHVNDWSKAYHIASSVNCTDISYSKNGDIFVGVCDDKKAYLFRKGRSSIASIEVFNPVHFIKFDWNSGVNRFAVVLDSGNIVLWKLIYEGMSDGRASYYQSKIATLRHNGTVEKIEFGSSGQILTVSGGKARLWDEGVLIPSENTTDSDEHHLLVRKSGQVGSLTNISMIFLAALAAAHPNFLE
ncbi:WD40 repeat domain-containing protein [Endozoicomonas montiporae]|nr:WD40 repeat domain-containing protein [Endozoicomonas montiporae]AMO58636.1 hypothetical protein EZMO1_4735 [Endozoicomonas montiporae CL-33]